MITSLHLSDGGVIEASKVHELLGFMAFWIVLCLNWLVIQLVFQHISFNSASSQFC